MDEKNHIYRNVLHLLKSRKYKITDNKLPNTITDEEYLIINTDTLSTLFIINQDSTLLKKSDVLVKQLKSMLQNHDRILLIIKNKLSPNMYKKIQLISIYYIETLLFEALIFNFTTNIVTINTRYTKLSKDKAAGLLEFIDLEPESLQHICYDDKACIWYDLNVDDIVQIDTICPLSGILSTSYRLVTKERLGSQRQLISKKNTLISEEKESDQEEDKQKSDQYEDAITDPHQEEDDDL